MPFINIAKFFKFSSRKAVCRQFHATHRLLQCGRTVKSRSRKTHQQHQAVPLLQTQRNSCDVACLDQQHSQQDACSRRHVLLASTVGAYMAAQLLSSKPATAALVQFPCAELNNRYILIRAGESESESQDAILTNPAWKTSMAAGLSERGKAQVLRQTIPSMQTLGVCGEAGCWLWPSVTQNSYQTAEILAGILGVGRSRIVPEYSFLDARGVGALEGLRLGTVYQQVWDGDSLDSNWRPPKGYDGTPPESTADVLTRMRQLLSVTETQYSGEDVVIITPDSDTLSILQAAVLGLDLRRHSELAMKPGEVRPLLLSRQRPDMQPRSIPCPRPPACV